MNLYLMRHGQATAPEINPERPLTKPGREEVLRLARGLKESIIKPIRIVHSHKLRAAETAEIVRKTLSPRIACEPWDGLAPNDSIESTVDKVGEMEVERQDSALMIVGHLPFLQILASHLLQDPALDARLKLPPAGVLCLSKGNAGPWHFDRNVGPPSIS